MNLQSNTLKTKYIDCDFCVVGGGISGMAAAIAAAREGIKVVLIHERPVLGGNASSEIRMWISGAKGENNRESGIIEEIALENMYRNPTKSYAIWDTVLYDLVIREKNIKLLLNCTCMDACVSEGEYAYGRDRRIKSVRGYQMTTQCFYEVRAKYFCDCSGDSILAPLSGAKYRWGREGASEFKEDTSVQIADTMTMGMSCLIQARETQESISFIPPEWSLHLTEKDFENRKPDIYADTENFWYLELGGDRNTIEDTEELREDLVSLAIGTWDYIKNSGDYNAGNWDLDFIGFLPGKRESRRLVGEYILTQKDISGGRVFEDEIAFGGWPLDDHYPSGFYHRGAPNFHVPTPAPYSIPYRILYSINVDNLFFAGRNVSATHMAMSSTRVMATCGLLGQAVGKAVSIAVKNNFAPHDVYLYKIEELQDCLLKEDCFLPSKVRKVSSVCKAATLLGANDNIRNGQDRIHALYGNSGKEPNKVSESKPIVYTFEETEIHAVHITFDSDLNRKTLNGDWCEREQMTRALRRLDSPRLCMPKTLCKEFELIGKRNGKSKCLLSVKENRKRSYHVFVNGVYDELVLIPKSSWGDGKEISVISFDFS